MLPKKKIKTKNVNKVNKVPALKKITSPTNKMLKTSSPNKQFKKATGNYISSRKAIPSARINLIQPKETST